MPQNQLNPGDRVVELAALAQSAAIFTGIVAAPICAWLAKRSWAVVFVALVLGGVMGFIVGLVVGRVFYRSGDQATVVRAGSAALPSAIPAGLAGGLVSALAVAGATVLLLSGQPLSVFTASLVCGVVIGVAVACLGSLA